MSTDPARRQRGLTLIELLMFIVIIGVALVGILEVLWFTTVHSADPLRQKQALMIAESLLEEVQLAGFTWCDPSSDNADSAKSREECTIGEEFGQVLPEPSGPRPYDNINDYVAAANQPSYAFNNAAGLLANANGNAMNIEGYSAQLTIAPAKLGSGIGEIGATGTSANVDVLRISVAVTYDDDKRLVLDGYRTRYAPKEPEDE
jgi:MSHA pilin protein MshD